MSLSGGLPKNFSVSTIFNNPRSSNNNVDERRENASVLEEKKEENNINIDLFNINIEQVNNYFCEYTRKFLTNFNVLREAMLDRKSFTEETIKSIETIDEFNALFEDGEIKEQNIIYRDNAGRMSDPDFPGIVTKRSVLVDLIFTGAGKAIMHHITKTLPPPMYWTVELNESLKKNIYTRLDWKNKWNEEDELPKIVKREIEKFDLINDLIEKDVSFSPKRKETVIGELLKLSIDSLKKELDDLRHVDFTNKVDFLLDIVKGYTLFKEASLHALNEYDEYMFGCGKFFQTKLKEIERPILDALNEIIFDMNIKNKDLQHKGEKQWVLEKFAERCVELKVDDPVAVLKQKTSLEIWESRGYKAFKKMLPRCESNFIEYFEGNIVKKIKEIQEKHEKKEYEERALRILSL